MDTIVTLHEYFNTSNQTSPHFERHENFIDDIMSHPCGLVSTLHHDKRCDFIRTDNPCEDFFLINYYELLYCIIGSEQIWMMAAFLLIVLAILIYLYIIVTSASSKFFCPSISVFAYLLGLSENVAGVTLLAFSNGVNDLLGGFAGRDKLTRLYFSDTHGSNFCLVSVVAATLIIKEPFSMHGYACLRDIGFLLLYVAAIDLFYLSHNNKVTLAEGILLLIIYISYIVVVIVEHFLVKEAKRRIKPNELRGTLSTTLYLKHYNPVLIKKKTTHEIINITSPPTSFDTMYPRNHNLWKQLWEGLDPINHDEWNRKGWIGRTICILRAPHLFVLNLFLPVVDYEARRCGWSKLLNCIQIIILPFGVGILFFEGKVALYLPLLMYSLFVSVPLSIYIFYSTRTHETPFHHTYMSALTIVGAIAVSYTCAMEVLAIFDAIGFITGRGSTFLGATLMAWSNTCNDLLTSIILASQGHVEMAFSGCYGAAIYNCAVTLAIYLVYGAYDSPELEKSFPKGTTGETVNVFLLVSQIMLLLGVLTTNFRLRRSMGIWLAIIYALFVTFALLSEIEVLHAFGSDHHYDMKLSVIDIHAEDESEAQTVDYD